MTFAPAPIHQRETNVNTSLKTCATCEYFPDAACTNMDGRTQTSSNDPACPLYFNIGDVERGL
jgi:hypothetical protein